LTGCAPSPVFFIFELKKASFGVLGLVASFDLGLETEQAYSGFQEEVDR